MFKAKEWYDKAAKNGNHVAKPILDVKIGLLINIDELSIERYEKSAQQGLAISQFNLGNIYSNGYGVVLKQDYQNNLEILEDDEKSQINEEIAYRERLLSKAKERNKYLQEKIKSVSNEELVDNNLYTKKLIHAKANSSFLELNFFKMINYIKILEGYKYNGII